MKKDFRRALGFSGAALLLFVLGCGAASQPAGGIGGAGPVDGGTACGSVTCGENQVCIEARCGYTPGIKTCPPSYSCVALPSTCQGQPSCTCLQALSSRFDCGAMYYGALTCPKGCE